MGEQPVHALFQVKKPQRRAEFFPFGRGDRGSKRRVFVEFKQWGSMMRAHEVSIKIAQQGGLPVTFVKVGIVNMRGKVSVFHSADFSGAFQNVKLALREFSTVRHNNKVIQAKRRKLEV